MKLPESRRHRIMLAVGAAVAIAAYVAISRAVPHEDLQEILNDVARTLGEWTYLLVGAFAFLETGAFVGLVVPGETIMLLGGAVAGQGECDVYLLVGIAWLAAFLGDTTSFWLGHRLGRGFVLRRGPRFGISNERFAGVERYFERHGGKTILIGRFIGFVRALAPFVAGSSGMRYRALVPYSILGAGIWSTAHIALGYFFSRSVEEAARYAGRGIFLLGLLIALIAGGILLFRFLKVHENRKRVVGWMDRRPVFRQLTSLGRRMQPQARFVWARLTPGGRFGLEFTSVLSVMAVGLYVLVAYAVLVSGDPSPTAGDMWAHDRAENLRSGWLTDVAELITKLGAPGVVLGIGAVAGLGLAARRKWAEVAILAAGLGIAFGTVELLKANLDRPRPEGGLVGTEGSSFPSGHAAYSAIYVWLAVTLAWRLMPGITWRTAVVTTGLVIAGLIGLSRVYLEVHYLSDVNAGWALGAAAFASCVAVALIAGQFGPGKSPRRRVRQNGGGDPGSGR